MTPLEFRNEMRSHYMRANCFHTMRDPDSDATSGNHHVINATYLLVYDKLRGSIEGEDIQMIDTFINSTENATGWFDRHPAKMGDWEAHDDNVGIITASHLSLIPYHGEVLYIYGSTWRFLKLWKVPFPLKWYFSNVPNETTYQLRGWHGRFPWLTALYKAGAEEPIRLLDKLGYVFYLMGDVLFNNKKEGESGRILKWLANSTMKGRSLMIDWAINKWENHIISVYGDDAMGEVLGIYHGADHPFARAMKGKI